jgi:hypothetical protein
MGLIWNIWWAIGKFQQSLSLRRKLQEIWILNSATQRLEVAALDFSASSSFGRIYGQKANYCLQFRVQICSWKNNWEVSLFMLQNIKIISILSFYYSVPVAVAVVCRMREDSVVINKGPRGISKESVTVSPKYYSRTFRRAKEILEKYLST